jgi:predicted Fe-Mo cluster-binding NifX family protein
MTRIAVPYYGALSLPPSGLSRVFFLVEVNQEAKSVDNISLQVWNPKKEPNLSSWLKLLGTNGVICSDTPSQYEVALNTEGIWVQWKQEGEVHEVVERWLQSTPERTQKSAYESPADSSIPGGLKHAWQLN